MTACGILSLLWSPFYLVFTVPCLPGSSEVEFVFVSLVSWLLLRWEEGMLIVCYHIQQGGTQPFWANLFFINTKSVFLHFCSPGSSCFLLPFWPFPGFQVRSHSLSPEILTLAICLEIPTVTILHTECSIYCLALHHLSICMNTSLINYRAFWGTVWSMNTLCLSSTHTSDSVGEVLYSRSWAIPLLCGLL